MSGRAPYFLPTLILLAMSGLVGVLSAGPETGTSSKWEYNTTQITLDQLTKTLTDMGNDGWEVFSIQDTRSIVETDPATSAPHVKTEMFQVTAKRPAP